MLSMHTPCTDVLFSCFWVFLFWNDKYNQIHSTQNFMLYVFRKLNKKIKWTFIHFWSWFILDQLRRPCWLWPPTTAVQCTHGLPGRTCSEINIFETANRTEYTVRRTSNETWPWSSDLFVSYSCWLDCFQLLIWRDEGELQLPV